MSRRAERLVLAGAIGVPALAAAPSLQDGARANVAPPAAPATVTVDLRHPVNQFVPDHALGAGVDGHGEGEVAQIYTRRNLRAMHAAGLRSLTYRLRTELAVEAWHWNRLGRWSDTRRRQGYWTSSDRPGPSFATTYGYRLPRRGNTFDQANDDGYPRLDDGSRATFWKSNPYLDPRFAGRSAPPQWVLVDLERPRPVGALGLDWAAPFARRFRVERWTGSNANFAVAPLSGRWEPFPRASFAGHAGRQGVRLAAQPVLIRFVRILLTDSPHTLAGSRLTVQLPPSSISVVRIRSAR